MDLLDKRRLTETDFFKVWNWINLLNKRTNDDPSFFDYWKDFYFDNMEDYNMHEKLQDVISINKVKTRFFHNNIDMTEDMIQNFISDNISNISIRLAFEDHIRFNSKIISKLVKRDYDEKKQFDFNGFIRRSLSFTDFVIKNKEIYLSTFKDVDNYKRHDFIFESDPDLNIATKLKRYSFPHQSFYNFLDPNNLSIPRKKFLVHLSYFFQFNIEMMENLMNQSGYTIIKSRHLMDEIIAYCLIMGVSFENLKNVLSYKGYNF